MGILAAIFEARNSGYGQVVDAAISDGVSSLMSLFQMQKARSSFQEKRSSNLLDGSMPYYTVYETLDKAYISLAPIEPKFFRVLCEKISLPAALHDAQNDPTRRLELRDAIADIIRQRTRRQWCELLEGTDVCFAPVLSLSEAVTYPHNQSRGTFMDIDGVVQPAPAPTFFTYSVSDPEKGA